MSTSTAPAARHPDDAATFARRVRRDWLEVLEEVRDLGPAVACDLPILGPATLLHRREDVAAVLRGDGTTFVMAPLLAPLAPYFGTRGMMTLDGDAHLERRRLVLPAFHGAALQGMEAELRALARETAPTWAADAAIPLLHRTQELTFDAILRVAFGVHDPERAAAAGRELRDHYAAAGRGETRDQRPVEGLVQGLLDERRATDRGAVDLLGMLLDARDEDGVGLDDPTLRDELLTTLTAGHETTATALAWAVLRLARAPEVVARLRAERHDGGHELLDATVTEVLRLHPPLIGMGRVTTEDVELGGTTIPAGEQVIAGALLVHRDPERYDDAERFSPDRFVGVRPAQADFLPFGGARHRCAGAAFARLELRVVLEELLDACDLEPAGPLPPTALLVNTQVPRDNAMVRVRAR